MFEKHENKRLTWGCQSTQASLPYIVSYFGQQLWNLAVLLVLNGISPDRIHWFGLVPYILSTVRFTPDHYLSSSYTTSQTLETSADTANVHCSVQGHNLQYSDIQRFKKNNEAQHVKNTFENQFSIPLRFT